MRNVAALTTALLSVGAHAFPRLNPEGLQHMNDMVQHMDLSKRAASQSASQAESNCGPDGPCLVFDATEQFVSITGDHAYQSPSASQIRGPCPGLNAAANHNYLPRSGVPTIVQTITGLGEAYGMSVDLAGFLAAYAVALDGDVVSGAWSIGGPPPDSNTLGGLLGSAQGISWSHNKYEGDTSVARPDAYLNNGDAYSLDPQKFAEIYATGLDDDRYTFDKFRLNTRTKQQQSISQNSHYFAPLFSTTLVAPAAYNFVINFMSNHSATEKSGYLNGDMFKTFFGIAGDYPNFKWLPGEEKIPENWYRRPSTHQYNAVNVFQDLIIGWQAYPDTFRFGGNTNGVNTYEGINPFDLTKGTYSMNNLFEGDNFACLFFQTQEQAVPDVLKNGVNAVADATALINKYSNGIFSKFTCPELKGYDNSIFQKYTGHSYSPTPSSNGQG